MISASRGWLKDSEASRARTSSFHSGMVGSRNEIHRVHESLPGLALARKHAASLGGQAVEPPPALAGLLHPPSQQPSAFFEPVEERIERRHMELQLPIGTRLDQLAGLVAVARASFDNRQDDELSRSFLQLAIEHALVRRWHNHICYV